MDRDWLALPYCVTIVMRIPMGLPGGVLSNVNSTGSDHSEWFAALSQ